MARKKTRRIAQVDLKLLWCKSGGVCAICQRGLALPGTSGVIGEMAHIVAHGDRGPRADADLSLDKLNAYENLILLCPDHHRQVDTQPQKWPPRKLRSLKRTTEEWVTRRLQSPRNAASKCLFVISGPSGVGKDVIINRLIHTLDAKEVPAVNLRRFTTRRRRPDERYHTPFAYPSEQRFHAKVRLGEIGCVHTSLGHCYGCDPLFSPAAEPGTAIFYSMRVYGFLPTLRETAEDVGVNVRNILILADEDSVRARILMRSAPPEEKVRRIDQALADLNYLKNHSEFVNTFFDLVEENSDTHRLTVVMDNLQSYVRATMDQIGEISRYSDRRTIESRATSD